jgi:hypothetical protein
VGLPALDTGWKAGPQAFQTPFAAWFRSEIKSAVTFLHFRLFLWTLHVKQRVQATSKIFPMPPFSAAA